MARDDAMEKVSPGGLAPWQVKLTLRYLLLDLCAHFPVEELARRCGLSRSHFTRAFTISLGTPPHRWLVRQRLRRAGELLERTNDSISTIALNCGFSDQSHLTRTFHTRIGISPAVWRRLRKAGLTPAIGARPSPAP